MLKNLISFFIVLLSTTIIAQVNYSNRWEDLFSYNNVKKIVTTDNQLFALCDNAIFEYNIKNQSIKKISSVNGLSGETTSAIHYHKKSKQLIIGYENGLLEIIDQKGKIKVAPDIVNFNQSGLKQINAIYEYQNKLYLATSFAIVVYNIEKLEFGDTYFIGSKSNPININSLTVLNNTIYAATNNGVFLADATNPNLIDSSNWELRFQGSYSNLITFNNNVFASNSNKLVQLNQTVNTIKTFAQKIKDLKTDSTSLIVTTPEKATLFNKTLNQISEINRDGKYYFILNSAQKKGETLFLATKRFGVLTKKINSTNFKEIHPDGPLHNDTFSIDAHDNKLWVVYGGYGNVYQPLGIRKGYSYFNGKKWINTPYNPNTPFTDLNHITIDKNNSEKVYISSMGYSNDTKSKYSGGLIEINNNQITNIYNHNNSSIEYISSVYPKATTVRVTGTAFDSNKNLWIANVGANNRIQKKSATGEWKSFNIGAIYNNEAFGMNEIAIDKRNTLWIGTRQNGVYVFNEKGQQKLSFSTKPSKGNLPNLTIKTIAVDNRDRVWMGTLSGLVVYENASSIFNNNFYKAEPIVILDGDLPQKLLGDQTINSIAIDGADNKWFGTDNSGVLLTNGTGQKTLAQFNTKNSPLPSNKIVKIKVDNVTGKVYFATDKGIVVYKSEVAPFGEQLSEVYAYPNPVLKNHSSVTIDGRKGSHLPKGTNVKILDTAGNLVFETNVREDQQSFGGKAVWNKRNLAGIKVASGIYIVLLSNEDGTESATTKIAIIN